MASISRPIKPFKLVINELKVTPLPKGPTVPPEPNTRGVQVIVFIGHEGPDQIGGEVVSTLPIPKFPSPEKVEQTTVTQALAALAATQVCFSIGHEGNTPLLTREIFERPQVPEASDVSCVC
jgi:hypothetical protein